MLLAPNNVKNCALSCVLTKTHGKGAFAVCIWLVQSKEGFAVCFGRKHTTKNVHGKDYRIGPKLAKSRAKSSCPKPARRRRP